jgi:hypothetical protein
LERRSRLHQVTQGIVVKHLDEGISGSVQGLAQYAIRQDRALGVYGLEAHYDSHVGFRVADHLAESDCLCWLCQTQSSISAANRVDVSRYT